MDREELKEIIHSILDKLKNVKQEAPKAACFFRDDTGDSPCDVTTRYAIGEEG